MTILLPVRLRALAIWSGPGTYCSYKVIKKLLFYNVTYFHRSDGCVRGLERGGGEEEGLCPQLRDVAKEILTGLGTSARDLIAFQWQKHVRK